MTDIVSYWKDHPSENYGFLIQMTSAGLTHDFITREFIRHDGNLFPPLLHITSNSVPEPSSLLIISTGLLAMYEPIRRRERK